MVNPLPLPSGPFRSQTAWELGWTRRCLQRAVDEGRLHHVVRDVYLDSTLEDSQELRLACLRLVLPPHGVAVDRTAAWLWDVEVSSAPTEEVPDLEFFVLRGHSRIERAGVASGERDLSPDDVVELDGVLVANPSRTALDLACRSGRYDAIAALDAFARARGVTQSDLTSLLPRFRGRRGVVQARELVPLMDARAESSGESLTRIVILDAGLPCPVPQHWVVMGGVAVYRLDLAYPRYKIAVEYDGYDYHSDPERRKADKERRKWLRAHGWIVIVVRKDDFGDDARRVWVRELRDALVARRHCGRLART